MWLQGIVPPLRKKGDQLECANCKGITLLNVTYKVFSNILYTRLPPHVESELGHYQVEFHPGKSTINQVFGLRQILEKMKEFRISIHVLFVDFKSAYDSTERERMYVAMNELNIPQKLLRLVRMITPNTQSQIKIQSKFSAPLMIHKGVQQGDAPARLLFNPSAWGHLNPSSYCDVGRLFYGVFKLWSKLQRKK